MAYIVGLMSGTSLDGIDAALVEIHGSGLDTRVRLIGFLTQPFPREIREELQDAMSLERSHVQLICSLNFKLGELFADAAEAVCRQHGIACAELAAIGSHGQTIYHQPERTGPYVPSTLQIGEPAVIAYRTGALVVSNFRTMDMAAGGQGAPLVPWSEFLLYRSQERTRLLQNIGGIGNVTVLPRGAAPDQVFAFDTGPGNMVIDELCQQLFGQPYDEGGALAAQGRVDSELLERLMQMPYIHQAPPKSTGRELFGRDFARSLLAEYGQLDRHDLLATVTMFTAGTIAENYRMHIFPRYPADEVIVGGGGSYNRTLLQMLAGLLPEECRLFTQEDLGFSSAAKEAVAFAILANETLHRLPGNLPSATGAREPVILGNITYPPGKAGNGGSKE